MQISVGALKHLIQDEEGIPPAQQQLVCKGCLLFEDVAPLDWWRCVDGSPLLGEGAVIDMVLSFEADRKKPLPVLGQFEGFLSRKSGVFNPGPRCGARWMSK